MSKFKEIDIKLEMLSEKLSAKLTKDRPGYPEAFRTFEERRIDWAEGGILKAIIIQPTFESTGVNSEIWNFINIAWYNDSESRRKLVWRSKLLEKANFERIESKFDDLLIESEKTLSAIKLSDLK